MCGTKRTQCAGDSGLDSLLYEASILAGRRGTRRRPLLEAAKPASATDTSDVPLKPGFRRPQLRDAFAGSVQFIGTATTLIRYGALTILTDPNFLRTGEKIHVGYGIQSTRLTDPAMEFEKLPPIVSFSSRISMKIISTGWWRQDFLVTLPSTAKAAKSLRHGFRRSFALRTWDVVEVSRGDSRLRLFIGSRCHKYPCVPTRTSRSARFRPPLVTWNQEPLAGRRSSCGGYTCGKWRLQPPY